MKLLRMAGLQDIIKVSDMNNGKTRKNKRIVIVDVIGELFKVYSLATIVYCGGSLVPKGGQNILEAAAWGKVIFYGPSMEDFSEEKALLEDVAALLENAGAGIKIRSGKELLQNILPLLNDPLDLTRRGERGKAVVAANVGAAQRYAEMICKYI
jgi:3-deoxy-D-manno-octulosonic-acid transferase